MRTLEDDLNVDRAEAWVSTAFVGAVPSRSPVPSPHRGVALEGHIATQCAGPLLCDSRVSFWLHRTVYFPCVCAESVSPDLSVVSSSCEQHGPEPPKPRRPRALLQGLEGPTPSLMECPHPFPDPPHLSLKPCREFCRPTLAQP